MSNTFSILCVDDDAAVLMTQAAILRQGGFTVYAAGTLTEAQTVLQENRVDCVILDASLCNTERVCVYEKVREIQSAVTVVLHTGDPQALQQTCVQDKMTIAKPVPPRELVTRLKQILDTTRQRP